MSSKSQPVAPVGFVACRDGDSSSFKVAVVRMQRRGARDLGANQARVGNGLYRQMAASFQQGRRRRTVDDENAQRTKPLNKKDE